MPKTVATQAPAFHLGGSVKLAWCSCMASRVWLGMSTWSLGERVSVVMAPIRISLYGCYVDDAGERDAGGKPLGRRREKPDPNVTNVTRPTLVLKDSRQPAMVMAD